MKLRAALLPLAALVVTACDSGGTSSKEMERVAMDRARQELGLAANVPLESRVWTGRPHEGEVTLCGTVSSADGASKPIVPQRFVATGDPAKFLVFEPAHQQMVQSEMNMFESWASLCAGGQAT